MYDLQEFVSSLTDDQFRQLWTFATAGCVDTRGFWVAIFLALQARSVGPGNATWAAQLQRREDAAKS